jgi:hypothetical protein
VVCNLWLIITLTLLLCCYFSLIYSLKFEVSTHRHGCHWRALLKLDPRSCSRNTVAGMRGVG